MTLHLKKKSKKNLTTKINLYTTNESISNGFSFEKKSHYNKSLSVN